MRSEPRHLTQSSAYCSRSKSRPKEFEAKSGNAGRRRCERRSGRSDGHSQAKWKYTDDQSVGKTGKTNQFVANDCALTDLTT